MRTAGRVDAVGSDMSQLPCGSYAIDAVLGSELDESHDRVPSRASRSLAPQAQEAAADDRLCSDLCDDARA